jgi:hypothetical protein
LAGSTTDRAVQLVKHAFGLVTEGRRKAKRPYLVYPFAEPEEHYASRQSHREEIARFAAAVNGAEVGFGATSYREWLVSWPDMDRELAAHRAAIIERFQPLNEMFSFVGDGDGQGRRTAGEISVEGGSLPPCTMFHHYPLPTQLLFPLLRSKA